MNTLIEQERKLIDLLTRSVHRAFADARAAGVPDDVFGDVEAIARSMTAALPTIQIYDRLVGPFYDTAGLTKWRGVSRQAIHQAVAAGTIIACQLDGGQWVYPTWQFTDSKTTDSALLTLWATLSAAAEPWTCAVWLRSPQPELDGRSAVDWIAQGRPLEAALSCARADAHRWAA